MRQLLIIIFLLPTILLSQDKIEKWDMFELTLHGPSTGNPFMEVELSADFTLGDNSLTVKGFYDGNGIFKIRFMPTKEGAWKYETQSSATDLNGKHGSFACIAPSRNNKGPVQVTEKYHFKYAHGEPFYPVGTTLYCWELENYDATLKSLKGTGYTKVRFMPFPHKGNKLPLKPFEGEKHNWDFTRPNPEFWKIIDKSVLDLGELGIQADFILFHPYDRGEFGLDKMNNDEKKFYLEYVVARLSAYQNIWWSMANEYDLVDKSHDYWDRLGNIVAKADPYKHLHSVHGLPGSKYDWNEDWVTHVSYQISRDAEELTDLHTFKSQFNKPVILDEYGYEGDIGAYWGKLSGEEELFRHWTATIQGAYATHGESYGNVLYFWKGGTPVGKSFDRVSWLANEIFHNKEKPVPSGLTSISKDWAKAGDTYYLYYYGKTSVKSRTFYLPKGRNFFVDVIDTWEMSIEEKGIYSGKVTIEIPAKQYIAIRITKE